MQRLLGTPHRGLRLLPSSRSYSKGIRYTADKNKTPTIQTSSRRSHGRLIVDIPDVTTLLETSPTYRSLAAWAAANPSHPASLTRTDVAPGEIPNNLSKAESQSVLQDIREVDTWVETAKSSAEDAEVEGGYMMECPPGTLVEIRSTDSRIPLLGILLKRVDGKHYLLTSVGHVTVVSNVRETFQVRDFVRDEEFEPLLRYLPVPGSQPATPKEYQPNPDDASSLVKRIKQFRTRADRFFQGHMAAFNKAHETIADPDKHRYLTLQQIATAVFENSHIERQAAARRKAREDNTAKPGKRELTPEEVAEYGRPEALYAVHRVIMDHEAQAFSLTRLPGDEGSMMYEVAPATWVRDIQFTENQVRLLMEIAGGPMSVMPREKNVPLREFLERARRVVEISRETRGWSEFGVLGPARDVVREMAVGVDVTGGGGPGGVKWKGQDRRFLRFLQIWAAYGQFPRGSRLHSVGAGLLRLLGVYPDVPLTSSVAWTFLQEVREFSPWDLQARYAVRFPGMTALRRREDGTGYERELEVDVKGAIRQDIAQGKRRDWTGANIFAIDEPGTTLIDDAVSLERIPGSEDTWIHVHVADPGAFLNPRSNLATWLEALPQNLYLPGHPENMFPNDFYAETIMGRFSLAGGKPCLTFSARVNPAGEMVKVNIVPGTLGDVTFIRGEEVIKVATANHSKAIPVTAQTFSVGPPPTPPVHRDMTTADDLSAPQREDLQLLQQLGDRLSQRRIRAGALFAFPEKPSLTVVPPDSPAGDAFIQATYDDAGASGRVVAPHMVLAGEVAARFCTERGILAPFRVQPQAEVNWEMIEKLRGKAFDENGKLVSEEVLKEMIGEAGPVQLKVEGGRVSVMGVDGYVKVTSPLRRYSDLLGHWQVHEALAKQKNGVVFEKDELVGKLTAIRGREHLARVLESARGAKQWLLTALVRGWKFGEAEVPETFQWKVSEVLGRAVRGQLGWFGVEATAGIRGFAHVEGGTVRMAEIKKGDLFEVELEDVDVLDGRVGVRVLRRLNDKGEGDV